MFVHDRESDQVYLCPSLVSTSSLRLYLMPVQARDVSAADEQLRLMGDDFCRSLMQLMGLGQEHSSDRSAGPSRSASAISETDEAELQEAFMASEG